MGASVKKQQRREPNVTVPSAASSPKGKSSGPPHATGTFTGLSLYPEEANYLLQRGALAIYGTSSDDNDTKALSVADFAALVARDTSVSLACLEVYAFLKDQKLHPRRCLEPAAAASATAVGSRQDGRRVPHHVEESTGSCDVAFDVWKTAAVPIPPRADTSAEHATEPSAPAPAAKLRKQRKELVLVFRVAVCRYWDSAPRPQRLRLILQRSNARDGASSSCRSTLTRDHVPVKVAVVHHDRSVLLFEISAT
ncbi:unnamed protein product [Hyaloperonospora brassicae]|nr:unnamed protein product [Hyaloperonospora brassicae]